MRRRNCYQNYTKLG